MRVTNEQTRAVIAAVESMQKLVASGKGMSLDQADATGYTDACEEAFNEVRNLIDAAMSAALEDGNAGN